MKLKTILNSGDVVRFHAHSGIDKQKLSEHQWGVALVLEKIYPSCSKSLLLKALTHDAHEYYTGDIPANVKWQIPTLSSLLAQVEKRWEEYYDVYIDISSEEAFYLKLADVIEGMMYCVKQVRLGHINAKRPYRKWREAYLRYLISCDTNEFDISGANEIVANINREMEEL